MRHVATVVVLAMLLSGCAFVPRIELRDDYTFKRFLQPDKVVEDVRRDANGNPVLDPS